MFAMSLPSSISKTDCSGAQVAELTVSNISDLAGTGPGSRALSLCLCLVGLGLAIVEQVRVQDVSK